MFLEKLTESEKNELYLKLATYALSGNKNAKNIVIEKVNKHFDEYMVEISCNTIQNEQEVKVVSAMVVSDFYSHIWDLLGYDTTAIDNKMCKLVRKNLYKKFGEEYTSKFEEYKTQLLESDYYDL